jgi:DNA-binding Lrp family transcriptional regulator
MCSRATGAQGAPAHRHRPLRIRADIEDFRDWVRALPETIGVFVTSGRADFMIHVAVATNEDLYALVIDRLTSQEAIADVETSIIHEHLYDPHISLDGTVAPPD